jgi:hypothetical protein
VKNSIPYRRQYYFNLKIEPTANSRQFPIFYYLEVVVERAFLEIFGEEPELEMITLGNMTGPVKL